MDMLPVCAPVHTISIKESIWHQNIPVSEKEPVAEQVLALSIDDNTTASVQDALNKYLAVESLDNYVLERRQEVVIRVRAEVRKEITATSDVLIVMLKRYHFAQATQTSSKDRRAINLTSPLAVQVQQSVVNYTLAAVVKHAGLRPTNGHYTAYLHGADRTWLHANDRTVDTIDELPADLLQDAYVLFYRRM
jgi:ubiquitin C-terminal hydrolase